MRARLAALVIVLFLPGASAWGTVFAFASEAPWAMLEVRWDDRRTVSVDVDFTAEAEDEPLATLYLVEGDVDDYWEGHRRFVSARAWLGPNWGEERLVVAAPGVSFASDAALPVSFVAGRSHAISDQEYGVQSVGWLRFLVVSTGGHHVAFDVRSTDPGVQVAVATGDALVAWGDADGGADLAAETHVAAYGSGQSTSFELAERSVAYYRAAGADGRIVPPDGEARSYDDADPDEFLTAAAPGTWTFEVGGGPRALDGTDRIHVVGATVPASLGLAPAPLCDSGWTFALCY